MRYTPRSRLTALTFLLLGLIAGSAPPTLAGPARPPAPVAPPPADAGELPVVEGGRATGQKTAEAARQDGLTVLDLSDEWLPSIFSETPDKPEPLRPFLIDLANEKFRSGGKYSRAREDRYFEVFGIPRSLNLLRRRIAERRRHACHARVKDGVLEQLSRRAARARTYARSIGFSPANGCSSSAITERFSCANERTTAGTASRRRRSRICSPCGMGSSSALEARCWRTSVASGATFRPVRKSICHRRQPIGRGRFARHQPPNHAALHQAPGENADAWRAQKIARARRTRWRWTGPDANIDRARLHIPSRTCCDAEGPARAVRNQTPAGRVLRLLRTSS